ncbi:MAG: PAS domain-containing protein [Desulfuromonadales bacterium]|nr:PAS domain-containing protein [Desulfuromonadales bacterium]
MRTARDTQVYVRAVENVEDAVVATDRQGHIVLFNPAAQSFFCVSERQSLGRHFLDLFSSQASLLTLIPMALEGGRSVSNHENIFLQRGPSPPLPVSVSVSPIFTDTGKAEGVVMILRDLSRVRDLEEAVRRADRLSMLGTLAAGLAHEIKNPLGGIKGAAQLLELELAGQTGLKEYTRVMLREVERVDGIIEELMDLARPRPPQWSQVNLAKVLGDIILFQKEAHREKQIDFLLVLDPSIPPLPGDENLLTRLFLNLIKNAAEAIDRQGRVVITTKVASEFHLNTPGKRPMPLIVVEIRDSGRGIPSEELEKIFTPFYTTKGRGSGLGLATCQKIVGEHQGFLKVESVAGEGTLVAVSLPLLR